MKIDSSSGVELASDLAKLIRDNPNEASKLPVDIDYEDKSKQQGWYIEIDGKHTKSKRNRNVGIPEHLVKGLENIFGKENIRILMTSIKMLFVLMRT